MAEVRLRSIEKEFSGGVHAVKPCDLDISDGEFLVLVGPSGCGKSTLLRMIAGLEEPSGGTITIGSRDVTHVDPADRDIAMVFQNYALYPHKSAKENMAFALRLRKVPKAERERRIAETAKMLGIEELLNRKPGAMSGGQQQRVALGRAIVRDPACFLFDEPLSNLDAKMRNHTRSELRRLHKELQTTSVYVTHDQEEAMTLGDRVAVMKDGVMQQVGTPLEVYRAPANLFVAGFIGTPAMNLMQGEAKDGQATLASGFQVSLPTSLDGPITVGVRPQHFRVATDNDQGAVELKARLVEPLGDLADVHLEAADGSTLLARLDAEWAPAEGATCPIVIDRDRHHCFDSAGQRAN
jgi:ABC-type sugar transport system ATPase subunit